MLKASTRVIALTEHIELPRSSDADRKHGELLTRVEDLERALAGITAERVGAALTELSYESLLAAIPPGTMLIAYLKFAALDISADQILRIDPKISEKYAAFIVHSSPTRVSMFEVGLADEVERLVGLFLDEVAGSNPATPGGKGDGLSRLLLGPWFNNCQQISRIIVCADSELCRVPFGALPLEDGSYLLEKYTVSYVASMGDLLDAARPEPSLQVGKPVVIGNPDYDWRPESHLHPEVRPRRCFRTLRGAGEEAEAVASICGVTAIQGVRATRSALLGCDSPVLLHIATHGVFFANNGYNALRGRNYPPGPETSPLHCLYRMHHLESPMERSVLAVAGANTWLFGEELPPPEHAGVVTGAAISVMNLNATALVVLSACSTGRGDIVTGQGVQGLQSALRIAGTKAAVMSLWHVDDTSTKDLMRLFYERLATGLAVPEALRLAQLEIRQKYGTVRHWGAFICLGHGSAVPPACFRAP
jgi:hypothetical protein